LQVSQQASVLGCVVQMLVWQSKENTMIVQDKKTGEWYDPDVKFKELQSQSWFVELLKRMANK
jgi:hypothetical protein